MSPVSSFAFLAAESCPLIPLSIRNNRLTTFSTVKCDGWETYFHWVLFSITLAAFCRTIDLIDRFLTKIRSAFWANHFFDHPLLFFHYFCFLIINCYNFVCPYFFIILMSIRQKPFYINHGTSPSVRSPHNTVLACPYAASCRTIHTSTRNTHPSV